MRALLPLLLLGACHKKGDTGSASTGDDSGRSFVPDTADSGSVTGCGDAAGSLPDGLTELSWDDGAGYTSVGEQDFRVLDYELNEVKLNEAVRFELDRPALIYGFTIQYGVLPADPNAPVTAGLYPDFGYNGFDFWQWDPLWEGSLCAGDVTVGEWATYVFGQPVEIDHPGLVYVAHTKEGIDDPSWRFDVSTTNSDGSCSNFEDCHSAMNLPDVHQYTYNGARYYAYNGLSFPFQYDYMVRLYVKYTDEVAPEDKLFQPLEEPSLSSRSSWGDYDNDGYDDLYTGSTLYHNDGDGSFTDVTDTSGISALGITSSGGTWGDYDNDGCLDLLVFAESYSAGETLLHNECDGTFTDATAESGLSDLQDYDTCDNSGNHTPTPAASWWDIDGDGWLDLYEVGFICWNSYTYYADLVWHNNGDGTFTEITGQDGFLSTDDARYAGRGANPIDFDQDGDVDLAVNDYVLQPNLFYLNNGDGTVTESAPDLGLAGRETDFEGYPYYGHTIGAAWGDLDGDADFDEIQANLAHPRYFDFSSKTEVLLNDGTGYFGDIQGDWTYPAGDAGLRYQETHSVPLLGDFDQDGNLDLVITAVYDGRPTDFYWGNGDGTFSLDSFHAGLDVTNGWGVAAADIDHDGDLDLALSGTLDGESGGALYENHATHLGHWLQVGVVGDAGGNAWGIGAIVRVTAGGRTFIRSIPGGNAQGNQNSLVAHFGLGDAASVDSVQVTFPGGKLVEFAGPIDADERVWLHESGTMVSGWARQ